MKYQKDGTIPKSKLDECIEKFNKKQRPTIMKELTIEQKARAYDEALKKARLFYKDEHVDNEVNSALEVLFPELKESEDERIRKWLIALIKSNEYGPISNVGEMPCPKLNVLAWLKKQGEPKFKVGDWVVTSYGKVNQVVSVDKDGDGYTLDDDVYFSGSWKDMYHLWTIQDAKDGDVLAVENMIFIYKTVLASHIVSYCKLFNDKFEFFNDTRTCCEENSKVHPATKEQYDLLFEKMEKAGYMWDSKNKEVQKIEQKSAWSEEDEQTFNKSIETLEELGKEITKDKETATKFLKSAGIMDENGELAETYRVYKSTSNWSEEDENIRQWIISDINKLLALKKKSFIIADKEINWLKSLRPQNKCAYNPYKEVVESIAEMCVHYANSSDLEDFYDNVVAKCKDAKEYDSLFPQNPWKPSDEQMLQLGWIAKQNEDNMIGKELRSLYQDLKKLRGK